MGRRVEGWQPALPGKRSAFSFSKRPVAPAGVTPTRVVIRAPTSRAALKGRNTWSGDPPGAARSSVTSWSSLEEVLLAQARDIPREFRRGDRLF